jgi:hypothetical protein
LFVIGNSLVIGAVLLDIVFEYFMYRSFKNMVEVLNTVDEE